MAGYSASLGGKGKSLSGRVGKKKKKKGTVTAAKKKRVVKPKAVDPSGVKIDKAATGRGYGAGGFFGKGRARQPGIVGRVVGEALKKKGKARTGKGRQLRRVKKKK